MTREHPSVSEELYSSTLALSAKVSMVQDTPSEDAPGTENGIRCEIKALDMRYNKKGEPEVIEKPTHFYDTTPKEPFSEYALVTKRNFDKDNKIESTILRINSRPLLEALKKVVKYYPSNPERFDEPFSIESPFMMLYHHMEELAQLREDIDDDDMKMHINLLLDYLKFELGDSLVEVKKLLAAGFITFPLLWTIFKPGEFQYQSEYDHSRLYRLERINYDENKSMGKYLKLHCTYTDFDGKYRGRAREEIRIYEKLEFGGPIDIVSLSTFPLKYIKSEDQESIKLALVERGKKFFEFRGVQMVQYKGLFLRLKSPPDNFYNHEASPEDYAGVWLPHTSIGQVVIDCETFIEDFKGKRLVVERKQFGHASFLPDCAISDDADDDPMLCPPFLYGFSLRLKSWCQFFVTNIEPIQWNPNAFDSLVLPLAQKKVIHSLVSSHRFPSQAHDEAELKGKGLVMLLHGAAGAGKTMTAETVSEHTKRPLLIVSSGELGSWEGDVEYELKKLLRYATIWQAIVLIDEADVFLEERSSTTDRINRNGLVAVFLRQLEYFQGIIFMTSNRVEVFDPALKSRIHFALKYEPPSLEVRNKIWQKAVEKVPAEDLDIDLDRLLEAVAKLDMNGREITNTVNTASTLARDLGEKLGLHHIETILEVWSDFQVATQKKPVSCESTPAKS